MTSLRRHWITATALLLVLAGCGTTDADPVSGVSLAPPTPVGVATVRPDTTTSAPTGPTCNPLASLRPTPRQPRPPARSPAQPPSADARPALQPTTNGTGIYRRGDRLRGFGSTD